MDEAFQSDGSDCFPPPSTCSERLAAVLTGQLSALEGSLRSTFRFDPPVKISFCQKPRSNCPDRSTIVVVDQRR